MAVHNRTKKLYIISLFLLIHISDGIFMYRQIPDDNTGNRAYIVGTGEQMRRQRAYFLLFVFPVRLWHL